MLTIQGERDLTQGSLSGARRFSPRCGRSGDTLLVSVYEFVNSRDNYDLWEIDLGALTSPTRLTNTSRTKLIGSADVRDPAWRP